MLELTIFNKKGFILQIGFTLIQYSFMILFCMIIFILPGSPLCTNSYGSTVKVIGATTTYYSTLQTAYDSAVNGDLIQIQAVYFIEDLYIDQYKSVILQGGFDSAFSNITGFTSLDGNITVSSGSITIENLAMGLTDRDGDGVVDEADAFPDDPAEWIDSDSDDIGNNADLDDDNDGFSDIDDVFPLNQLEWADSDLDGIGDNTDSTDFPVLTLVSSYDSWGQARGTLKKGDIIYVANGTSGLQLLQISADGTLSQIGSYDTVSSARSLIKINNYVYIACREEGLLVFDVSVTTNPQLIFSYDTAGKSTFLTLDGPILYLSDRNSLQIFDVSIPHSPVWLSELPAPTEFEHIIVSEGIAYIAGYYSGFITVDVSNPYMPTIISRKNVGKALWAVEKIGNYVFTAGEGSGLILFDVQNPYNPQLINPYNTTYILSLPSLAEPKPADQPPFHMKSRGSYLFIADGYSGIQVVDISDPLSPFITTSFETPGYTWDFSFDGYTIVIGDYNNGVHMVNLGSNLDHDGDGIPNYLDPYPLTP